jgi:hypothetical protein
VKLRELSRFNNGTYKRLLRAEPINPNNPDFSEHHLLPRSLFPHLKDDPDNVIKLPHRIHTGVHFLYTNPELSMNPVYPIIEVVEELQPVSGEGATLGDVCRWK